MIADHSIRKKIAKTKLDSILGDPAMQEIHTLAQNIWDNFIKQQRPRYQQIYGALALVSAKTLKQASVETQLVYQMHSEVNGEEQIIEALKSAPDLFREHVDFLEDKGLLFERNQFFAIPNEFRPGQPLHALMLKVEPQNRPIMGALIRHVAVQSNKSDIVMSIADMRLVTALLLPEGPERNQKIKDSVPTTKKVDEAELFSRGHDLVEMLSKGTGVSVPPFVKVFRDKTEAEAIRESGVQNNIASGFSAASVKAGGANSDSNKQDEPTVRPVFEKTTVTPFKPKIVAPPVSEPSLVKTLKAIVDKEPAATREETRKAALLYNWLQGADKDGNRRSKDDAARHFGFELETVESKLKKINGLLAAHYEELEAKEQVSHGSKVDLHEAGALRP